MFRLSRTETTTETGSRRHRDPERHIPHEGDAEWNGPGGPPGVDPAALQEQIKALQDQIAAMQPGGNLGEFRSALDQYNPAFFDTFSQIQGLAGAFAPDKILALNRANQTSQLQGISQTFGRLGTGNTTAELNAINRAKAGFGAQDIQALMSGAQAQSGLLSQSLDPLTQGLQNLTIDEQLALQKLAAENAGKSPGGGGGGGCTLFCLVLTDWLHGKGDLTNEQYVKHLVVSGLKSDPVVYAGYLTWAVPLARQEWAYRAIRWAVRAYVLDAVGERPTWHGKAIGRAMRGLSAWLGNRLQPQLSHGC